MIPAPGNQTVRNPNPTPNSTAPRFGGWGPPPGKLAAVQPAPPPPEPRPVLVSPKPTEAPTEHFSINAIGYIQLVEEEYSHLVATRAGMAIPPLSLFSYFSIHAWWHRILTIQSRNRELTSSESRALECYNHLAPFSLTPRLAGYLDCLGNFSHNNVNYKLMIPRFELSSEFGVHGFISDSSGKVLRVNDASSVLYASFPIPGICWSAVVRDVSRHHGSEKCGEDLFPAVRPLPTDFVEADGVSETECLLGWKGYRRPHQPTTSTHGTKLPLGLCDRYLSKNMRFDEPGLAGFYRNVHQFTDWAISPYLIALVRQSLRDLGVDVVTSPLSQEGSAIQLTYVSVEMETRAPLRAAQSDDPRAHPVQRCEQKLCAGFQLPEGLVACAFLCAFNIEFVTSQDGEYLTRTPPWIGLRKGELRPPKTESFGLIQPIIPLVYRPQDGHPSRPTHQTMAVGRFHSPA